MEMLNSFLGTFDILTNICSDREHDDVEMEAKEDDDILYHDDSQQASSEGEGDDLQENMEQ